MVAIATVRGHQITVQIGNGATPTEAFAHPALINTSRSITFTNNAVSSPVPDATNPALPATTVRATESTDLKIDGAGLVHTSSVKEYLDWMASGVAKNIKVVIPGAATVTGSFLLTSFQLGGERMDLADCTLTLEAAGPYTVTVAV